MGAKCVLFTSSNKGTWNQAVETCRGYGGELLAWRDETEWRIAELFFAEMQVVGLAREAWAGANHDGGGLDLGTLRGSCSDGVRLAQTGTQSCWKILWCVHFS